MNFSSKECIWDYIILPFLKWGKICSKRHLNLGVLAWKIEMSSNRYFSLVNTGDMGKRTHNGYNTTREISFKSVGQGKVCIVPDTLKL